MKEIVISIYNFSFLPLYTYPASLPPLLQFYPSLPYFLSSTFLLLIPLSHPYPASPLTLLQFYPSLPYFLPSIFLLFIPLPHPPTVFFILESHALQYKAGYPDCSISVTAIFQNINIYNTQYKHAYNKKQRNFSRETRVVDFFGIDRFVNYVEKNVLKNYRF